jgi:hypothetical protein
MRFLFIFLFLSFFNPLFSQRITGSSYLVEQSVVSSVGEKGRQDSLYQLHMKRWRKQTQISLSIMCLAGISTYFIHNFVDSQKIDPRVVYSINAGVYLVSATFYLSANKHRKKAYKYL